MIGPTGRAKRYEQFSLSDVMTDAAYLLFVRHVLGPTLHRAARETSALTRVLLGAGEPGGGAAPDPRAWVSSFCRVVVE